MPWPASGCEARAVIVDYTLGGIVTLAVLVYLVVALLRPEWF